MSSSDTLDVSSRLERCLRALHASRDGFWECDLLDQQLWYSDSFLSMLGYQAGQLPRLRCDGKDWIHPDDLPGFRQAYGAALAKRSHFDYELRFLDAAGRWRWLRGRGQVWAGEAGEPTLISGAVTDVHREKIAQQALEEQSRRLEAQVLERTEGLAAALRLAGERQLDAERANAAKTRFLAHISHEIRTPLNGLLGLTELALRGAQSAGQRRYLEQAHASGQTLLQVISNVLDLSRIEAGRHELRPRSFDLADTLAGTLRALMPLAGDRDLLLLFDVEGEPGRLLGDDGALRQIITNLLGNAIKFTRQGHVALSAHCSWPSASDCALTIRVADTGPGIAPERRGSVFEPFVQGDDSGNAQAGAGLGLAIAQGLARSMGGQLTLDCPAEGGSVFTLQLSLRRAAQPAPAPAAPVDASTTAAPTHEPSTGAPPGLAWLVYPQAAPGEWVARRLARLGWRTEVKLGLDAALDAAGTGSAEAPDLVLVAEPSLPAGVDLRPLRQALPGSVLRLLIRPDWHDPVVEAQARSLDIQPLVAPLTPEQLHRMARPHDAAQAVQALRRPPPALNTEAEVLLVEDNPVNQLVGEEFLKALGLRVRLANDGEEALVACTQHPPALVLMDLQMPGMDGLTATTRLHAMQREGLWPGAPIVALTAHATAADQAACRAAGMSGVLTKPLSLDMLRQQLPRWLN